VLRFVRGWNRKVFSAAESPRWAEMLHTRNALLQLEQHWRQNATRETGGSGGNGGNGVGGVLFRHMRELREKMIGLVHAP
jgi:hypothetical protein